MSIGPLPDSPTTPVRTLLVEADPDTARVSRSRLEAAPEAFVVWPAASLTAALAALSEGEYELVVLGTFGRLGAASRLDAIRMIEARAGRAVVVALAASVADRDRLLGAGVADVYDAVEVGARLYTRSLLYAVERARARAAQGDLQRRAAELELENLRFQDESRLKDELLANVTHELRTPLNAIIGFAQVLECGLVAPDSPEHREYLGDILRGGRHLSRIINDLLDIASVEAGRISIEPERVVVADMAQEVTAVLRAVASERRVAVALDLAPEIDEVFVDGLRFKQVLYNFLSNALKFTPSGGSVVVRTRVVDDPAWFRVEVADTGRGIAEADVSKLFLRFERLGVGATTQGTGLGLALTKGLVEAQGGTVGVEQRPGGGSIFYALLPRSSADLRDSAEHSTAC